MLLVKNNILVFNGKSYRCAIGKGGFSEDKREGDGCTPVGKFRLRECWYRADRLSEPQTKLPLKIIHETDGWCDDSNSEHYNRHIIVPPASGGDKGGVLEKEYLLGEGPYSTRQPEALKSAKELRHNLTKAERKLWYEALTNKQLENFRFRKQMPIGSYIADFVCVEKNLIVELDGGQHGEEKGEAYDKKRTEFLEAAGYRVLRFWNPDVLNNLEGVAETIRLSLLNDHPPLDPPPQAGGAEVSPRKRGEEYAVLPLAGGAECGFERLFRDDHVYDIVVPIGYNDDPVVSGRGSAIFLHLAHEDYRPTEGCIALAKADLLAILPAIDTKTSIEIKP